MRLGVRVIPNAKRTEFAGRREGELVLRLNAPAVDGKANKAAVEFLADYFGISKSRVRLVTGERSRRKVFDIVGVEKTVDTKISGL